jgi:NADH-quinone oxidoreductase subunit E
VTLYVPRFGHGSRVPGWDEEVDLTKDPAVVPDPATTPVPADLRLQIEQSMAKYPDRRSAAIPALHAAQRVHGWCSPEAIDQVAAVMRVTPAYLTSVATFYDMLETEPRPKHDDVYVCTNISCSLRGADEFYEAMNTAAEDHPDVHVRSFECLGACDIAPMASVNGEYIGPLEPADAETIIEDLRAGRPVLPDKQLRYRRAADPEVTEGAREFGPPSEDTPKADTAGLGPEGDTVDRPGGTAAIEIPREQAEDR